MTSVWNYKMKNRKWARNKGLENSMWWYIANEDVARLTELTVYP